MSFQKMSKEERAEWRSLPATKAAIGILREHSAKYSERVLVALDSGDTHDATLNAGAAKSIRVLADILEND